MATTPEGKVKTAIKAVLKDEGVYYFMPRGTLLGRRGVSDFICCVNGKFLAIEAKARANKLSPTQMLEKDAVTKAGGVALVINESNLDQLRLIIQGMRL